MLEGYSDMFQGYSGIFCCFFVVNRDDFGVGDLITVVREGGTHAV